MEASIMVNNTLASISGWKWESDDPDLQRVLNNMLDPNGPSPSDPQPQINAAYKAAKILGGKVLREIPSVSEPDKVY